MAVMPQDQRSLCTERDKDHMLGGRFTRSDGTNTICRGTVGEIVMKYQGYLNNVSYFFLEGFHKMLFLTSYICIHPNARASYTICKWL